jgi:hypothetical protein
MSSTAFLKVVVSPGEKQRRRFMSPPTQDVAGVLLCYIDDRFTRTQAQTVFATKQ